MTDKQQPPERIWIDPQDSTFWNNTGDVKSLIPYARVQPVDDARVEEIRKLQTWRREHADKFTVTGVLHSACADINYLLSLLPQLSSSSLCVCSHAKSQHEAFNDHDECLGCRGLDEPCSEFRATVPSEMSAQGAPHSMGPFTIDPVARTVTLAPSVYTVRKEIVFRLTEATVIDGVESQPLVETSGRCGECAECGHSKGVDARGRCIETQRDPTAVDQGKHRDLLRDAGDWNHAHAAAIDQAAAGAIVCVNDPGAGARVEIRFAELGDAQRLHKALTQSCANSGERCCAWTLTEIDNPWYQTACGRETDGFDGGYCTYCGGVIKINGRRIEAVAATGASETDRRESEK